MTATSNALASHNGLTSEAFIQQWQRFLTAMAEVGAYVQEDEIAKHPFMQAQSVRYLMRIFMGMETTAIELDDPLYPRLVRLFDTYLPYNNTNPDCVYFFSRISDTETYRIHGKAGNCRILEVQIMDGHFPAGPDHSSLGTLTDLKGDADGNIDIVLSATPHDGNWVKLKPGASWLYMRQYYYDWENEQPADLVIERVGAVYPPPVISREELHARVERLIGWIPSWYRHLRSRVASYYDTPENTLFFVPSTAGMDDMLYGKGHFAMAEGECVIVEFAPPSCPYWSFQIMNDFWETLEFDMNQSSLNGHQAVLDSDGVFRAVISTSDPGVANWLDPVGNLNGLICARVYRPDVQPRVTMRRVALAELADHLPADTLLVDPQQRSDTLRRRFLATARRFRE